MEIETRRHCRLCSVAFDNWKDRNAHEESVHFNNDVGTFYYTFDDS